MKNDEMPTVHKDIREEFDVVSHKTDERRRFEAVGFLRKGEESVSGDEMLARTASKNGGAIGEDDHDFLWDRRGQIPFSLDEYDLLANVRNHDHPQNIKCLSPPTKFWYEIGRIPQWACLDIEFGKRFLVLRRVQG